MPKITTRILILTIIIVLALTACINGGNNKTERPAGDSSSNQISILSPDATATFGAEQLYIQLTAIAEQNQVLP